MSKLESKPERKPRLVWEKENLRVVKRGGSWDRVYDIERCSLDAMQQPRWNHVSCVSDATDTAAEQVLWQLLNTF